MNAKQAAETLSYYERERAAAARNNMDWLPSRQSRQEITDALAVIADASRVSRATAKAAENLESEAYRLPDGTLDTSN